LPLHWVASETQRPSVQVNEHTAHWSWVRTQLPSGQRSGATDGHTVVPPQRLGSVTQVPSAHWKGHIVPPHWVASTAHWPVVGHNTGRVEGHVLHCVEVTSQRPLHRTGRSTGQPLAEQSAAALTQLPSWQRTGHWAAQPVAALAQEPSGQRTLVVASHVETHWSGVATHVPLQNTGRSMGQLEHSAWDVTHTPLQRMERSWGQPLVPHVVALVTQVPSAQRAGHVAPQSTSVAAHRPSAQRTGVVEAHTEQSAVVATQAPLHATGRSTGQPLAAHRDASVTQLPSGQRAVQVLTHSDAAARQRPSPQRTGVALGHWVQAGSLVQSTSAQSNAPSWSSSTLPVHSSTAPPDDVPPLDEASVPDEGLPDDDGLVPEEGFTTDEPPACEDPAAMEDAPPLEDAPPVLEELDELELEDSPELLLEVPSPPLPLQATVKANNIPEKSRVPVPVIRMDSPPTVLVNGGDTAGVACPAR
jgi:hypothetical protein